MATKVLRVTLDDILGSVGPDSGVTGEVWARYVDAAGPRIIRYTDGTLVLPLPRRVPIPAGGVVDLTVVPSDDATVHADDRGFGIEVGWSVKVRGEHGRPTTLEGSRVVQVVTADSSPVAFGLKAVMVPAIPGATYATSGDIAAATSGKVDKGAIFLSINDYAGASPSAIATVLDQALADGAASKRTVVLGPGVWSSAKAGRHQVKSYSGLVGDPSGATVLKFTHPSGGLDVTDTAGTLGTYVYQVKLRDLILDGQNVVPKILTGTRIEELELRNVRLSNWTDAAIELTDASLVNTYRLEFGGVDATIPLPGIRLLGSTGSIEFASPNWFKCSGVELAGPGLTDMRFTGQPWFEACPDVLTINVPGAAVSIGRVEITGRVINTTTTCRLIRTVAAGSSTMNANLFDLRDLNVSASAATTPLLDFSAFANAGNAMVRFRESSLTLTAFTGQLLTVNASQAWNLMHAEFADLWGATPGSLYSTARWYPLLGYVTGGAYVRPLNLKGAGTPEGVFTAPVGSTYQRVDVGILSFYRKVSGNGNTGWQPMDTYGPVKTVTANYTLTYDDSVVLANGTSLVITLPTAASYGGRRFTIKNINASTATISGTVDGVASPTLAQNARMTIVTDGTAWRQID